MYYISFLCQRQLFYSYCPFPLFCHFDCFLSIAVIWTVFYCFICNWNWNKSKEKRSKLKKKGTKLTKLQTQGGGDSHPLAPPPLWPPLIGNPEELVF